MGIIHINRAAAGTAAATTRLLLLWLVILQTPSSDHVSQREQSGGKDAYQVPNLIFHPHTAIHQDYRRSSHEQHHTTSQPTTEFLHHTPDNGRLRDTWKKK